LIHSEICASVLGWDEDLAGAVDTTSLGAGALAAGSAVCAQAGRANRAMADAAQTKRFARSKARNSLQPRRNLARLPSETMTALHCFASGAPPDQAGTGWRIRGAPTFDSGEIVTDQMKPSDRFLL
jgi:hypothetical protein